MSIIDDNLVIRFGEIHFGEIENSWTEDFTQGLNDYIIHFDKLPFYETFLNQFGNIKFAEIDNFLLEDFGSFLFL